MSRRKPAKARITKFISQLQRQWQNLTSNCNRWLHRRWRLNAARPPWLRPLLIIWEVIALILTEIQRTARKKWKQRGQLWLYTRRRFAHAGFLLPMVSVLLVVFSLVIAAVLLQSINRTTEINSKRNEQVVYNSATLAVDRSKAKIEYLFNSDPRWPRGLPGDDKIEYMLLNGDPNPDPDDPDAIKPHDFNPETPQVEDPYTLPDETRLDIDGDGKIDNAWFFDLQGEQGTERIAYALLTRVTEKGGGQDEEDKEKLIKLPDSQKAPKLIVRNGPINMTQPTQAACVESINSDAGWEIINGATVRRAFQTIVVVVKDRETQRNVSTLEMQQDREADKGNKWGAWFRNDLEVFPGPDFNWNGAIHTEGNLVIGDSNDRFRSYLISSSNSCLYARQNSEITIGGNQDETTPPFLGQLIRGSLKTNSYSGSFRMDTHGADGPEDVFLVNDSNNGSNHIDSVESGSPSPIELSLDPVVLWTTNENVARGSDPENGTRRDPKWKDSSLVQDGRVFNSSSQPPYVDDTYRADGRYGPKPRYTQLIGLYKKVGSKILDADPNSNILLFDSENKPEDSGLDGYWERRARGEGLTIIVGQRLELGNTFGWEGADDPLYPFEGGSCTGSRCHEQKQWKTLRDNLAAVQSTVVYHNDRVFSDSKPISAKFPLACLASTVHPGTRTSNDGNDLGGGTITDAKTFGRTEDDKVDTDFFIGKGTNGWEFNAPDNKDTNATFANQLGTMTPLRKALSNLAHFAGDPDGAYPARQDGNGNIAEPLVGPVVHPYPMLSMWGDYSDLRRAMEIIDENDNYFALSMSDQSTVQTAACTLGMLAYNIENVMSYDYTANQNDIEELAVALLEPDSQPNSVAAILKEKLEDPDLDLDPEDLKPEDYIEALESAPSTYKSREYTVDVDGNTIPMPGTMNSKTNRQLAPVLAKIARKEQLMRDRHYGFADYIDTIPGGPHEFPLDQRDIKFNPADNGYFGLSITTDAEAINAIAQAVSPAGVKFPALFYIFPTVQHDHDGAGDYAQPNSEPYIQANYVSTVNLGYQYKVVDPADIILNPRERTNWEIPNTTTLSDRVNVIRDNTTNVAIGFLDKNMFNGREMMSLRTMDIDLDLLRRTPVLNNENWLPYSGIVYAFREDAVREDEIARPSNTSFSSCDTAAEITSSSCRMDAVSANPQDPPVNDKNWVSSKPVDFYADPDRRPYGFRLRKGGDLRQEPPGPTDFQLMGLSFVSDNPVYVFGDTQAGKEYIFNGHFSTSDGSRIEEFKETLDNNWNNFYSRSKINDNFAQMGDTWRPAEIISDAISIVSNEFVDGSIAEGIRRQNVGNLSSYRTLNAPNTADRSWLREDGSVSNAKDYPIPIKISRNGLPLFCSNPSGGNVADDSNPDSCVRKGNEIREYDGNFMKFSDGKDRINAQGNTRVNFTIVSGLVPSRERQSYGGLHNFPRFVENWGGDNLFISGAMIQLNFSTYATGPFDQDSWEPDQNPQGAELINYYKPPNRRWGYDVGLQYAPAGPVASRFIAPSNTRSEFYREPPIDDPYMCLLRKAKLANGNSANIDPDPSNC